MLAFVFQRLAMRKPDLDSGVYAYAKAGFGEYLGFFSAFGYWASACVGNVTYWILIMSTVGAFFPCSGRATPRRVRRVLGVRVAVLPAGARGVKEAAAINRMVTVAKVLPIIIVRVCSLFLLDPQVLMDNFEGYGITGPLFDQVRGTMLATVFVFLGVEGASVYSRHARRREDVGRATVLGFLMVLAIFASVTIVSYGILPRAELAAAAPAVDGGRARGRGRALGRGVREHRPDRLRAGRLPGLDPDVVRGAVRRRQGPGHAAVPRPVGRERRAPAPRSLTTASSRWSCSSPCCPTTRSRSRST